MTDLFTLSRAAVLGAISLALMSCATPSSPTLLPPSVCVETQPEPLIEGGLVQAVTPEEQEAQATFLQSVAAILDWGRTGWDRAETAKKAC